MAEEAVENRQDGKVPQAGVRWLTPENAHVFEGTYSLLHCALSGDGLYRAVFAVRMFPISHPDRFVSLRYMDRDDKVREIGVIADLNVFPADAQGLVRASLAKQCYERRILRVHEVKEEFGYLFFWVLTDEGWDRFVTPWRSDRAEDYGEHGKLILDSFDNRYVIPDLADLSPADRARLTSYVYW